MFLRKINLCVIGAATVSLSMPLYARVETGDILHGIANENYFQLKECAEKGDRICMRNLGLFYNYKFKMPDGKISQDIPKAMVWLSQTTLFPVSRYSLGKLYVKEKGKEKTGESLLFSACVENNEDACHALNDVYSAVSVKSVLCDNNACNNSIYIIKKIIEINRSDDSLTEDYKKWVEGEYNAKLAQKLIQRKEPSVVPLLEKEVENDAPFASMLLAPLYEKGELVPRNFVRAYMMYDLTGTGYADEKAKLAAQMTPEQVREAQEMSWRWQDEHRSYRAGYRGSDMGVQWKLEQR